MNWYLAKIVHRITCGSGDHMPQFDEQLRLIGACDRESAFNKAVSLGQATETCFMNHRKETVRWNFVDVTEIHMLDELVDGAEIYSRICEQENPEQYVQLAHERARHVQEHITMKLQIA